MQMRTLPAPVGMMRSPWRVPIWSLMMIRPADSLVLVVPLNEDLYEGSAQHTESRSTFVCGATMRSAALIASTPGTIAAGGGSDAVGGTADAGASIEIDDRIVGVAAATENRSRATPMGARHRRRRD